MQSLNHFEQNIERLNEQLRTLKERKSSLQTSLSGIVSNSENQDKQRLDQLKLSLVNLKSNFSDKYPDVIKTKLEIAKLEARVVKSGKSDNKAKEDNPVYITLASQLSGINTEITSVKRYIKDIENKKDDYRKRIEATPRVEELLKSMLTEQISTSLKYEDLMKKFMESKVAQGLEKAQKGERFTLIDPPMIPEKPFKPNRIAIFFIGLVLSIGAGAGFAALREFSDQSVHKAETLVYTTSFPVLAEIPDFFNDREIKGKARKRIFLIVGSIIFVVAAIIVFHFFIMDINVFWAKLMRKL